MANRLIWTAENSFVREGFLRHEFPGVFSNYRFHLWLTSGARCLPLYIHSTTLEGAIDCLELLIGLRDDHFDRMELSEHHIADERRRRLCTLTCRLLEKVLLQSTKRKHVFSDMTFAPDHWINSSSRMHQL
jgi:hypothetical protein